MTIFGVSECNVSIEFGAILERLGGQYCDAMQILQLYSIFGWSGK